MERARIDITECSYAEFVAFIFDREVEFHARGDRFHPWYFDVEVLFNPERVCKYYIRLFRDPDFLIQRFSKAQLEQGFWAIHGDGFDCSTQRIIEKNDVPISSRCECIRAMFGLFSRVFATEPLDTSVFMWWDSLCYQWHCGIRNRDRGGEDELLQDVFFEVLVRILQVDSEVCQDAPFMV
jgi:hypothetical protein